VGNLKSAPHTRPKMRRLIKCGLRVHENRRSKRQPKGWRGRLKIQCGKEQTNGLKGVGFCNAMESLGSSLDSQRESALTRGERRKKERVYK